MSENSLFWILSEKFKNGIEYLDARELCAALFCSADWLPEAKELQLSKEYIAAEFEALAINGFINNYTTGVPLDITQKGRRHWLELIDTALSSGSFYDKRKVHNLFEV